MTMLDLQIYSPAENQFIRTIEFNYPEIKAYLAEALEKYKGLVFTDGQMTEAKRTRAELNRFKNALEDKRKEIKKQLLEPYNDFEAKMKDLAGDIDGAVSGIDAQIKAWEEELRKNKRAEIGEIYGEIVPEDFREIMPLEKIFVDKWLNATVSLKSAGKEIQERFDGCMLDMDALKLLDSPYLEQIKAFYLRTLDIGQALKEGNRLEAEAAKMREYEERQREAKERQEAAQKAAQEAQTARQAVVPPEEPESLPAEQEPPPSGPVFKDYAFGIRLTEELLQELKAWIRKNNIKIWSV